MEKISTKNAPGAIGPYSQGTVVNGMVYTSGQIGIDPTTGEIVPGGIEAQAKQVLKNILAILEAAGTSQKKIVKTLCFLTDIKDFAVFNEIYAKYITNSPARSCVEIGALPKGALCEIEVIAEL